MNRRIVLCALATTALTAVGLIAPVTSSASVVGSHTSRSAARVTQVEVPVLGSAFYTGSLGVANGNIVVGDQTSSTVCRVAVVEPVSLRLDSNRSTSCSSPTLDGASAIPVESLVTPKSRIGEVRIATRSASGASQLGPVVMQYENSSTSLPEWTYGGGYLWLYDTALSKSAQSTQRGAEVLRISLTTGGVLATVAAPSLIRVELAADADGLWIARSEETTSSTSEYPGVIYFVGTRAKKSVDVIKVGDYAAWLAAAGHTAWATLIGASKNGADVVDTFSSPTSKPHVATLSATADVPVESGQEPFDAQPVLVDPHGGLFFVMAGYVGHRYQAVVYQRIFTFNPANGRESKIAAVRTPKGTLQANIEYDGSLYLLTGGESLDATLFRVHP
jgi:hypothetical protein